MEKIIKENGKIYLVTSNDGYWKHINKRTIGSYEEEKNDKPIKIDKPNKKKAQKKGVE